MYENITYNELKGLPEEQKKDALIELKNKYSTYKEMAEKVGGTPVALSNLYLRIVEGKKFGRRKKEETEAKLQEIAKTSKAFIVSTKPKLPAISYASIMEDKKMSDSNATKTKYEGMSFTMLTEMDKEQQNQNAPTPSKITKKVAFTIGLEIVVSGEEARERIQGVIGSLLKDKTYKVKLSIEEV